MLGPVQSNYTGEAYYSATRVIISFLPPIDVTEVCHHPQYTEIGIKREKTEL